VVAAAVLVASTVGEQFATVAPGIRIGCDDDVAGRVDESLAAPSGSHGEQDREQKSPHRAPSVRTQMNWTCAFSEPFSIALAMGGPADSQAALDANPGMDPSARTSAGRSKNQITSVHMGDASDLNTPNAAD
jgi:hypothetical protein